MLNLYKLFILFVQLFFCSVQGDLIVNTKYGKVQGIKTEFGQAFLGIPYAQPPVGSLRWQAPVEPIPWQSTYNATQLKPGCPQHGCFATNPAFVCPSETSESCLFLNVWTPEPSPGPVETFPVMLYIHGGNFVHMSSSSPIFRGDYFANKGKVILVTFDYRLGDRFYAELYGALGFLYTGPSPDDARGNYGIQDQLLAMKWVQENIKNFGGDPTRVTLFGQSAGAQSVSIHLMSESTSSLFRNVIIESSPFDIPMKSPVEALYLASLVKKFLNCTTKEYMHCLRSKTAEEIAQAQLDARAEPTSLKLLEFFEPLGPFVDGKIVPYEPIDAIQKGRIRNVPTIIGTVSEEARIFVYEAWGKPLTTAEYAAVMLATYPTHMPEILLKYPPSKTGDSRDVLTKVGTDFIFTCAARNMTRNFIKTNPDVYRYIFSQSFSFDGWGNFTYCEGHVCHGEEIAFVFHSADQSGFNFNKGEETLSNTMIGYWTNFAYTSDPGRGPHQIDVIWPKYDSIHKSMKFLIPNDIIVTDYEQEFCDFWDTIGYKA
ncbi:hypothetical protein ACF0H5_012465 [Mactra antiquata]